MTQKTKKTIGTDKFYEIFVGEYMQFIMDATQHSSIVEEETGQVISQESPMTVSGYLLEHDSHHYYLGVSPLAVSHAIRKNSYFLATISDPDGFNMDELEISNVPKEELN